MVFEPPDTLRCATEQGLIDRLNRLPVGTGLIISGEGVVGDEPIVSWS